MTLTRRLFLQAVSLLAVAPRKKRTGLYPSLNLYPSTDLYPSAGK